MGICRLPFPPGFPEAPLLPEGVRRCECSGCRAEQTGSGPGRSDAESVPGHSRSPHSNNNSSNSSSAHAAARGGAGGTERCACPIAIRAMLQAAQEQGIELSVLPGEGGVPQRPARRIDIKSYPREYLAYATLSFTGSNILNRRCVGAGVGVWQVSWEVLKPCGAAARACAMRAGDVAVAL
jgi:hypothetical protein